MIGLFESKKRRVEDHANEALKKQLDAEAALNEDELFVPADYDATTAEKTGYSNYSYWRSTFQVFLKNRMAVLMLVVLALLLLFTFIQPLLPNQYGPNAVNNNPATGIQLSNQSPRMTTVYHTLGEGIELIGEQIDEEWYAVSNVLMEIKARKEFTLTEYGEDWCQIEYDGQVGYVQNNFQTKLKLPEDPTAVPYECKSNFQLSVYTTPFDYSNAGEVFYVTADSIEVVDAENGLVVTKEGAELRNIPSDKAFIFGTNNIGQDLWARVWSGTRTSLWIGFVVAFFEAFIGILVGVLWGYVRRLDRLITEIYNVVDNIPNTIILILISYIMKPSIGTLIFAMSLTRWLGMARFIRNQIVIIRDRDYNLASRCLGTSTWRIMLKNLLPYLVSVIMLRMALAIPNAIGSEVFITYIGLGLSVDTPSLGNLINEGRKLVTSASLRYQLMFPTIVLSIITIAFYIIGNAFSDAADPKNHM